MKKIALSIIVLLANINLSGCDEKKPTTYEDCLNICAEKYFNSSYENYMNCKQNCTVISENLAK